mmetsp:Transcript_15906/g.44000  ORF Transcript_15906/g.44000 Transcript_15906/m.44000 type:complete len:349 (+) Transcript_15906:122-1168(+)|eukprot:CAMPEP_0172362562 /NCGR_PEP_ID=MMETSP1060-20121228/6159_1 /TAXON_ID=37318 /ORGANISM="Pseudo-nitzschia pungens, Strain cf. cingulata" /LENGTH=348 /DNA_ID=CAMNT_0013085101 /DNA_START=60 /DNA_END=1106 /DNA_ORIENTATION=-
MTSSWSLHVRPSGDIHRTVLLEESPNTKFGSKFVTSTTLQHTLQSHQISTVPRDTQDVRHRIASYRSALDRVASLGRLCNSIPGGGTTTHAPSGFHVRAATHPQAFSVERGKGDRRGVHLAPLLGRLQPLAGLPKIVGNLFSRLVRAGHRPPTALGSDQDPTPGPGELLQNPPGDADLLLRVARGFVPFEKGFHHLPVHRVAGIVSEVMPGVADQNVHDPREINALERGQTRLDRVLSFLLGLDPAQVIRGFDSAAHGDRQLVARYSVGHEGIPAFRQRAKMLSDPHSHKGRRNQGNCCSCKLESGGIRKTYMNRTKPYWKCGKELPYSIFDTWFFQKGGFSLFKARK